MIKEDCSAVPESNLKYDGKHVLAVITYFLLSGNISDPVLSWLHSMSYHSLSPSTVKGDFVADLIHLPLFNP